MQDFRNDITNLLSHQHADATLDDSSRDTINNIVNSLAVYFFKALLQKGKTDIFSLIPSGLRNNAMIWCSENSKGVYLKVSNRVISLDKLGAISSEYGNLSQQDLNVVGCCIEYIVAELVDESLSKTNEITGKILVSNIRKDKDITSLLRKAKITIGKPRSRRAGSRKSRRGGSRKSRRAGSRKSRRAGSRKSRRAGSRKSRRATSRKSRRGESLNLRKIFNFKEFTKSRRAASRKSRRAGSRKSRRAASRKSRRAGSRKSRRAASRKSRRAGSRKSRRAGSRKSRRAGSRKSRRAGSRKSRRAASRKSRRAGSRKSLVNKRMMTRVEKIIKKHIKDHGEDLSNLTVHMIRNNVNEKLKLRTDKEFRNTYIMPILMKIMNQ